MLRYHKQVYFPADSPSKLDIFCQNLTAQDWSFSTHAIERIKDNGKLSNILTAIKKYAFDYQDIFEYYQDNGDIVKAVFRIGYTLQYDIIFVVSSEKNLITVYLNDTQDKHFTLNTNQYQTA
jgi:hypothetical protein